MIEVNVTVSSRKMLVPVISILLTTILGTDTVHGLAAPSPPSSGMERRHVLQSASAMSSALIGGLVSSSPLRAEAAPSLVSSSTLASSSLQPVTKLSDGTAFPLASFGLQIYNDDTAYRLTMTALEVGYRNFFASVLAGNQKGFAKAVRASGIPREDLFICGSVVSNRVQGFDAALKATTVGWKQNMEIFSKNGNIDYLDQIMLDYPGPDAPSIQGQWASFEQMHSQKLTKTLSLSNFSPRQLDYLFMNSPQVRPVVNQMPYSVAYHKPRVVEDNQQRDILVQAWAPLGGSLGGRFNSAIKAKCAQIGEPYGKSFAQVALRWIVQSGASFTTQTKSKEHFQEDLNIFDFELTNDEMAELSSLA